jgi:hypothetical protein
MIAADNSLPANAVRCDAKRPRASSMRSGLAMRGSVGQEGRIARLDPFVLLVDCQSTSTVQFLRHTVIIFFMRVRPCMHREVHLEMGQSNRMAKNHSGKVYTFSRKYYRGTHELLVPRQYM